MGSCALNIDRPRFLRLSSDIYPVIRFLNSLTSALSIHWRRSLHLLSLEKSDNAFEIEV